MSCLVFKSLAISLAVAVIFSTCRSVGFALAAYREFAALFKVATGLVLPTQAGTCLVVGNTTVVCTSAPNKPKFEHHHRLAADHHSGSESATLARCSFGHR